MAPSAPSSRLDADDQRRRGLALRVAAARLHVDSDSATDLRRSDAERNANRAVGEGLRRDGARGIDAMRDQCGFRSLYLRSVARAAAQPARGEPVAFDGCDEVRDVR